MIIIVIIIVVISIIIINVITIIITIIINAIITIIIIIIIIIISVIIIVTVAAAKPWSLTHWGRDKMDAISQTPFSSAFSWKKMFEFRLKFHLSLFLGAPLTIFQHWFRKWLGAVQATSHYQNQWWLVYRRIYASPGLNELIIHYTMTLAVGGKVTQPHCVKDEHTYCPNGS